jgi:hypothetical protein
VYHAKIRSTKLDIFLQIINTFNRENVFAKRYTLGNTYNGLDDDDDWVAEEHDTNGNGEPDAGEPNVDEADESKIQENKISLFPIIPTIGFTWEF